MVDALVMTEPLEFHPENPQIVALKEEIEKLRKIIDLYIAPNYGDIFSEDEEISRAVQEALVLRRKANNEKLASVPDLQVNVQEVIEKFDRLMGKQRKGAIGNKRLQKTDSILIRGQNVPIAFSQMGKLQEFSKNTRRQNMTKLGKVYEQFPDRYEIRQSKLGGKTVRLNNNYYRKLIKDGV